MATFYFFKDSKLLIIACMFSTLATFTIKNIYINIIIEIYTLKTLSKYNNNPPIAKHTHKYFQMSKMSHTKNYLDNTMKRKMLEQRLRQKVLFNLLDYNHVFFVLFGMKGEMLCILVLSGQEIMTNGLSSKVEKSHA